MILRRILRSCHRHGKSIASLVASVLVSIETGFGLHWLVAGTTVAGSVLVYAIPNAPHVDWETVEARAVQRRKLRFAKRRERDA
jgi:hypothetical protein